MWLLVEALTSFGLGTIVSYHTNLGLPAVYIPQSKEMEKQQTATFFLNKSLDDTYLFCYSLLIRSKLLGPSHSVRTTGTMLVATILEAAILEAAILEAAILKKPS